MRISDWSSDVCSSDRLAVAPDRQPARRRKGRPDPPLGIAQHHGERLEDIHVLIVETQAEQRAHENVEGEAHHLGDQVDDRAARCHRSTSLLRSEERRVGKECVSKWKSRWAADQYK